MGFVEWNDNEGEAVKKHVYKRDLTCQRSIIRKSYKAYPCIIFLLIQKQMERETM